MDIVQRINIEQLRWSGDEDDLGIGGFRGRGRHCPHCKDQVKEKLSFFDVTNCQEARAKQMCLEESENK